MQWERQKGKNIDVRENHGVGAGDGEQCGVVRKESGMNANVFTPVQAEDSPCKNNMIIHGVLD